MNTFTIVDRPVNVNVLLQPEKNHSSFTSAYIPQQNRAAENLSEEASSVLLVQSLLSCHGNQ